MLFSDYESDQPDFQLHLLKCSWILLVISLLFLVALTDLSSIRTNKIISVYPLSEEDLSNQEMAEITKSEWCTEYRVRHIHKGMDSGNWYYIACIVLYSALISIYCNTHAVDIFSTFYVFVMIRMQSVETYCICRNYLIKLSFNLIF